MTVRKSILLGAAAVLALGGSALQATPIVQTLNFGGSPPGLDTGDYPQLVSFSLFNSNLGTLNSVTIDLSDNLLASVIAINTDTKNAHTVSAMSGSTTTSVSAFGGLLSTLTLTSTVVPGSNFPLLLAKSGSAGSSWQYDSPSAVTKTSNVTQNSNLSSWQAVGGGVSGTPLEVTAESSGSGTSDGGIKVVYGSGGALYGTITLTYDYTPNTPTVPEPVSMLLVGGSLLGLGVFARRQSAKRG